VTQTIYTHMNKHKNNKKEIGKGLSRQFERKREIVVISNDA
jgi:hypothetical protein